MDAFTKEEVAAGYVYGRNYVLLDIQGRIWSTPKHSQCCFLVHPPGTLLQIPVTPRLDAAFMGILQRYGYALSACHFVHTRHFISQGRPILNLILFRNAR